MDDITKFLVYHKDQYYSLTLAKIHTGEYSVFNVCDDECGVIDVLYEGPKEKCINYVNSPMNKYICSTTHVSTSYIQQSCTVIVNQRELLFL